MQSRLAWLASPKYSIEVVALGFCRNVVPVWVLQFSGTVYQDVLLISTERLILARYLPFALSSLSASDAVSSGEAEDFMRS